MNAVWFHRLFAGMQDARQTGRCKAVASKATSLVSAMHDTVARMTPQQSQTANPGDKPMLSLRPVRTHVNVMVAGGSNHVGKLPYYKMAIEPETTPDTQVTPDKTASAASRPQAETYSSPHALFAKDPSAWASALDPVLVPEAGRELVYTFQVRITKHACTQSLVVLSTILTAGARPEFARLV